MLCDRTIRKLVAAGQLGIDPMPQDQRFQPASVDLLLGTSFIELWNRFCDRNLYDAERFEANDPRTGVICQVHLQPGDCVLATTIETVRIPRDVVARVEGKSTWGRRFLMVHSTAGFIDPGFEGQITLELCNLSQQPLTVTVGEPIAQISFDWLDGPADRPYGHADLHSHYQHQTGATEPR